MMLHFDRHLTYLDGSNALLWSRFNHAESWGVQGGFRRCLEA